MYHGESNILSIKDHLKLSKVLFNKSLFSLSNWVFATNSDFLILVSLQPNVVDLKYFKSYKAPRNSDLAKVEAAIQSLASRAASNIPAGPTGGRWGALILKLIDMDEPAQCFPVAYAAWQILWDAMLWDAASRWWMQRRIFVHWENNNICEGWKKC